jgi:2-hydroxychromene-2-carboxylate isomerase
MSSKTIHFYFDYLSPYAYFAWRRLPALERQYDCQIEAHPVMFGKLLDKWRQLGPAEIPLKQQWLMQGENKNQCKGSSLAKVKIYSSMRCVFDFQLWWECFR